MYGTEDNTDYSIDGMLAIAKDINSDMNNKDVKGVVLVLNKKYSEEEGIKELEQPTLP